MSLRPDGNIPNRSARADNIRTTRRFGAPGSAPRDRSPESNECFASLFSSPGRQLHHFLFQPPEVERGRRAFGNPPIHPRIFGTMDPQAKHLAHAAPNAITDNGVANLSWRGEEDLSRDSRIPRQDEQEHSSIVQTSSRCKEKPDCPPLSYRLRRRKLGRRPTKRRYGGQICALRLWERVGIGLLPGDAGGRSARYVSGFAPGTHAAVLGTASKVDKFASFVLPHFSSHSDPHSFTPCPPAAEPVARSPCPASIPSTRRSA